MPSHPAYSGDGGGRILEEIIVVESGELAVDPASPNTKWWHNYLSPGQSGGRDQMLNPATGCQTPLAVSRDPKAPRHTRSGSPVLHPRVTA